MAFFDPESSISWSFLAQLTRIQFRRDLMDALSQQSAALKKQKQINTINIKHEE